VGRRLLLWGPVALWAAALFFASSMSDVGPAGRIPDWVTHGLAYLVFALLIARALAGGLGRVLPGRAVAITTLLATLYGASDEWHQSFVPGREASAGDVAKDLGGALSGALLFRRLSRSGQRRLETAK
jgi:VanZ family protein